MVSLNKKSGGVSVVIPAKNEARSLDLLLPEIRRRVPAAEIIVVNDGSSDNTSDVCRKHKAKVIHRPYSVGNGGAVKAGARAAAGETLIFMDADGQHDPKDIPKLLAKLADGYDMIVGARDRSSQANVGRLCANRIYNRLASWMVGHDIADLTSGFRAVRASKFKEFLNLLPNGFSYPTTITMSFFRAGYAVSYLPIHARARTGKSHINPLRDGARFLIIIFKVGTLYAPLKIFLPLSLLNFALGVGYYLYTFINFNRFTNMSALLFISSLLIFLIGLVSEQITALMYKGSGKN